MDEQYVSIAGEITALRFVLSVMLAHDLAQRPDGDEVLVDLAKRVDAALRFRGRMPAHASPDVVMAVQTAAIAAAERFFETTADRYGEIA